MSPNRYEVLGKIADGGLGSVYKAYDRNLRREVALKRMRADTPELAEQQAGELLNEARTLSSLQHPHIVTIYDVGRDEEGAYLIMELLKGETLEDIIGRGALNEVDFQELVSQSLEGMIAAHATGLIHLDIKPQNFMVVWLPSGKFQIKILDFGLSKIAHQPTVQAMDEEGAIMGSIFFMAPEQFERSPVDVRTDLYSLGCVYYYALTQHYPFQGETGVEVMTSHLYHSMYPLAQLRPDLPPFISQWVEWLMNRLPEHRPADAATAYEYFRNGMTPSGTRHAEPVVDTGGVPVGGETAAAPARPSVKRPTRSIPTARTGAASQPLANKRAPRPVVKHVNIATAEAPAHLVKGGKPVSKALVLGIPAVLILIAAIVLFVMHQAEAAKVARMNELQNQPQPSGTVADVMMLLDMVDDPERSEVASNILAKLRGVDSEDERLVRQLSQSKSPLAQKTLVRALGRRGVHDAAAGMIDLLGATKDADLRIALWDALANAAQVPDLSDMLGKMSDTSGKELAEAEKTITNVALQDSNVERRGGPVVKAYKANSGTDDVQAALIRIMGKVNGPQALAELRKALKDSNVKLRAAAIYALGQWPTGDPLPDLMALLATEKSPLQRGDIETSIGKLAAESSDVPQAVIAQALINAYRNAKDEELRKILSALGNVTDPASQAFLKDIAEKDRDPAKKALAKEREKAVGDALSRAISVTDGAILPADKAEIPAGPFKRDGVLMNWRRRSDRIAWTIQVAQPLKYDVSVDQASTAAFPGQYVLCIGPDKFEHHVEPTSKLTLFKTVTLGHVHFTKPGVYRVTISPTEIATDDQLMHLKLVSLKKSEE